MARRPPFDPDALRRRLAHESGPRLWRSLEELADAPEVRRWIEAEFPDAVEAGAVDRRAILRLMGASFALAGVAACEGGGAVRNAPLLSQPRNAPEYTPGVPLLFATSLDLSGYGRGVLVKAQEGRPIKIEGNPLHPASLGATDVFAEAEILALYDPDRPRAPSEDRGERSWADLERMARATRAELIASGGRGLRILLSPIASPTVERLAGIARQRLPEAGWHHYGPIASGNAEAGSRMAFGRPLDATYDLAQADVVVTLGGDLFLQEPGHIRYAADTMARRRAADHELPRLVAVESSPSLVGAKADRRIALPPNGVEDFARALAAALGASGATAGAETDAAVAAIAADLRRAGRRGLVAAGREQPPVVHALAYAINAALGAFGTTLRAIEPVLPPAGESESIVALADAIAAGAVSHLLVLGGNPAYDAPADLDFAGLLRRVPLSVYLGTHRNETAAACRWHIPQRHALESWGDLRAFDGTVGLRQPATVPVADGISVEEALAELAGEAGEARELVQATWRQAWGEDFEARWLSALEAGVIPDTAFPPVNASLRPDWDPDPTPPSPARGLTALFAPDPSMWDGRFANNGWLQELPKPLTKQVWGNAALIAPATAVLLGLETGDVAAIRVGALSIEAPVWVLPGHASDCVTLPLGYGRARAGRIGDLVGFDAYRVRPARQPWIADDVGITPTGRRQELISTQLHHALPGDGVVRIVAPGEPEGDIAAPAPLASLYPEYVYEGYAWGMAVDLDACIGCNACVIACQAENNVPVVGPEEVARGREMHWLRVDRYHAGGSDDPRTYFQPVPCMHCEKAPCEIVCPVNATVHSAEGLNDMVYNRCIGTRTCSNNCPYKVRRFNFFDYRSGDLAPPEAALNPHVTVRDRGVMEKCTYCVQRIAAARIDARIENRPIRDGEIRTACQDACPTRAIVFGDVNDPDTAVSRLKRSVRNYALLGELNTQPRTTYLARVEISGEAAEGEK